MIRLSLFASLSLLSLTGCATRSDLELINNRVDGVTDQVGELSNAPGVVTTTFSDDTNELECNVGELVDGYMTVILDTTNGRVQTVRGWERVLLGGLSVNADNICIDSDSKAITLDRITAAIGTDLGKVGIGGGVTAECLMGMNGTPCTIKQPDPVPAPIAPVDPTDPTATATPVDPAPTATTAPAPTTPVTTPDEDPGTSPA